MKEIALFIVGSVKNLGYAGIFLLMFLESSFFPFPSEVVMPPAGYLAAKGQMSLELAILFGTMGSLAGALFNYYIALFLGRPFLERYGKYIFLTPEKLEKVDIFFKNHGSISIFTGRLLPGIRQYISLPAGVSKMNLIPFTFFTVVGAGIWVSILTLLGYMIGNNETLLERHIHKATIGCVLFALFTVSFYVLWRKKKAKSVIS